MPLKIQLILFCLMLSFCSPIVAQTKTSNSEDSTSSKKELRKEKRVHKLAEGKLIITPFAAPGYTPELGALLAAGGLATWKTNKTDPIIQRSSFTFAASYSTTGAVVLSGILNSYWREDKIRINGDFWYKDMPDHYWGIGYEKNFNTEKSDSTTAYHRHWWWINPSVLFQFKEDLFVGINIDYNYTKGSQESEGVKKDKTYRKYNHKPLNSGLGFIIRYDSRDVPVNAWKGLLFDFKSTFYSPILGGDNKYQVYQIDYRQFQEIISKGNTLAWQIKMRIATGDIPYGEMSEIGSPFDLRGYTWGRYRDECSFFVMAEYRYIFKKKNQELSKHGAVAWVATGTVFNLPILNDNQNRFLPNCGIGYRLEVQPRMCLRLDFGIGRESTGFYFNFNQAF